ncbi:MAG: hypothetical protein H6999_01970 [Hahellaceae bacterium]|nr:hypothetical protein [Hahellaceae bacterium]MCP5168517.1 hypothetical protein [Hahellaceae bacterium]
MTGFWSGYSRESAMFAHEREEMVRIRAEKEALQQELYELRGQNESMRQELVVLDRGRAVDEVAQRGALETIQKLENSVRQLREDVTFYKRIMAPSSNTKGLTIQKLELGNSAREKKYTYKLVLTQMTDNKRYIEGVVAVNLIGERNGEAEVLPLRDVSADVQELGIKFRFRYFQEISGEITLPDDFKPVKVQVVAQASGKNASSIEQSFDWSI